MQDDHPVSKANWEDTPEKREASLQERKAKMILAARQCVSTTVVKFACLTLYHQATTCATSSERRGRHKAKFFMTITSYRGDTYLQQRSNFLMIPSVPNSFSVS